MQYVGKFNVTRTKTTEGMGTARRLQNKWLQVMGKMPGERFKRMLRANRLFWKFMTGLCVTVMHLWCTFAPEGGREREREIELENFIQSKPNN